MKWTHITLAEALQSAKVFVDGDWIESKDQDPNGNIRLVQLADVGEGYYINKSSRFLTSEKAKELRDNMTVAEQLLWQRLKRNQLSHRFKPQHPIDIFIADFYCHELKLVIEVDGSIHDQQKEYDSGRTEELENNNITVIRFSNDEVINDIENVMARIKNKIEEIKIANSEMKSE